MRERFRPVSQKGVMEKSPIALALVFGMDGKLAEKIYWVGFLGSRYFW